MVEDNLAVLRLLAANPDGPWRDADQQVLARWHGWGAAPRVFDRPEHQNTRAELETLIGTAGVRAAARTTLNAHYTDPRLVDLLWKTITDLGVTEGPVLEPGCGSGEILAAAPVGFQGWGVELDPTTAAVATARLTGAGHQVVPGSFAETPIEPGAASAVVGNVPFGSFALFDATHNPTRALSIHDHFLAKSVEALAPGGVAAVITSRFTLDASTPAGRMAIGRHADFLGAVRLPATAHRAHAGTGVVTDLVLFRRRAEGQDPAHAPGFLDRPVQHGPDDHKLRVSAYWSQHPNHVAGELTSRTSQFGYEVDVVAADWQAAVEDAVGALLSDVEAAPAPVPSGASPVAAAAEKTTPAGRIQLTSSGVFQAWDGTAWAGHDCPRTQRGELTALIGLRDRAEALVELEGDGQASDDLIELQRQELATAYRDYVDRWGPINRVSVSESGRRNPPRLGGFRSDPGWARVAALEVYDAETGRSAPADLLERRVVHPALPVVEATSPADAVAMSLHQHGSLRADTIGTLLGVPEDEVDSALGDLAYRDPATGGLIESGEYLSGNVREKLEAAEAAGPLWERNVAALRDVMPRDIHADELGGLLGAPWVPEDLIGSYVAHLADVVPDRGEIRVTRSEELGRWQLLVSHRVKARLGEDHPFGQRSYAAEKVLQDGLNGVAPLVRKPAEKGERPVVDLEATETARQQLAEMRDHFDHWLIRDDDDRTARVMGIYNERFNSIVPRNYAGVTVDPPGMIESFRLRPHQHAAVARMIRGGDTLLAHPVGAGKTAEQIVGAMELRRLGVINRPLFVVPNHMLDQMTGDIQRLFPAAEVLAMTREDVSPKGRAAFAARVRSHDWDAIVTTHSAFGAWPLSARALQVVQERQVESYRRDLTAISEAAGRQPGDRGTTLTKGLEKRLATLEERLKATTARIAARQDHHAIPFDESGVDYLVVDELHEFKNLGVVSAAGQIRGVPSANGSAMAEDLSWKLDHLRRANPGRPVITGATGTPIANTVAEMWVMGRYIRPQLLEDLGLGPFDAFRMQFCQVEATMELDDTGTKFRSIPRLARYQQLPELARWWGEFADMVSVEDLGLPRPEVAGGGRQVVVVPPAPGLTEWMQTEVVSRADAIAGGRVEPTEDNNLKLSSDLRLAAFDWEGFSGEDVDPSCSTLVAAADRIARIHHDNVDRLYRSADGLPHDRPGAFQLVFADLGVPSARVGPGASAYERLRDELVARGIPANQIAFAGDHAKDGASKEAFFEACRTGRVSVAISSTQRMGVGTNVQDRLIALHHLNAPWRPSDMEQREGRIVRQGNQNDQVELIAYATERSASVTAWQTLERKAGFIGQVMRAEPDGPRAAEVIDDEALSYGEIKALATGDPDFRAAAEAEQDLARLDRLARGHARTIDSAKRRLQSYKSELTATKATISAIEPFAAKVEQLRNEAGTGPTPWSVTIGEKTLTNRAEAAQAAIDTVGYGYQPRALGTTNTGAVMEFAPTGARSGTLRLVDDRGQGLGINVVVDDRFSLKEMTQAIITASGREARFPSRLNDARARAVDLEGRIGPAERTVATPFPNTTELADTRRKVTEIHQRITDRYGDESQEPGTPTRPSTGTSPPSPPIQPPAPARRPLPRPVPRLRPQAPPSSDSRRRL